jgi:hypothetical protein
MFSVAAFPFFSSEYRTMADRVGAVCVHSRASEDERSREDSVGALRCSPVHATALISLKKKMGVAADVMQAIPSLCICMDGVF